MTQVGAGGVTIKKVSFGRRFSKDRKKLPKHVQELISDKIRGLYQNPHPPGLRFEKLKGYSKPDVYTIHVTMNYKISLEVVGSEAKLRRAGKHDEIDRCP